VCLWLVWATRASFLLFRMDFTGTALTGFVIAHDCGHRSFAKRRWVNDLVGHLLLPLIYQLAILHNYHHTHTKLDEDNWHPFNQSCMLCRSTRAVGLSATGRFGGWHQLCIGQRCTLTCLNSRSNIERK